MFSAAFEYHRPGTLAEAVSLLRQKGDAAKLLAGGHSLLPMMKLRLASPAHLIDLGRVPELAGIREEGGAARIGAMTTHEQLAASPVLKGKWQALAEAAGVIGDMQVRARGTIGGSLAHADPAADLPAPLLAFEAEIRVLGPGGERTIAAGDFFRGLFTTALRADDVITEVRLPAPPAGTGCAYVKFPHPASRFAVAGVAAVLTIEGGTCRRARVAVTGAAGAPARCRATEAALEGKAINAEAIAAAAGKAADGLECLEDLVAAPDYRAHLACVMAKRALTAAAGRARA